MRWGVMIGGTTLGADLAFSSVFIMSIRGHRRSLDLKSRMN